MHRRSYVKSIIIAAATGLFAGSASVALLRLVGDSPVQLAVGLAFGLLATFSLLVASGGWICLWRDGRIESGRGDPLTLAMNRDSRPTRLSKPWLRAVLGSAPRPGDVVRVRPLVDIQRTLAADNTLDGLPFMPEMENCCGRQFRVHRRVDKINDMRHKTGLRRMRDAVTLVAVRCGGTAHDGCQAECQVLWKDEWLERVSGHDFERPGVIGLGDPRPSSLRAADGSYFCQMTRLWESSSPMSRMDWRQDLRPLLKGNVGFIAWLALMLTRAFNIFQEWRGGVGFPYMPMKAEGLPVPASPGIPYAPGTSLAVRSRQEIAQTLVNNRTRGLWFDKDMIRFCGTTSVVEKRVERVIHEATGQMVTMKTPSVILRDVFATGEFLRLCPQHEHIFWREAWLSPVSSPSLPSQFQR